MVLHFYIKSCVSLPTGSGPVDLRYDTLIITRFLLCSILLKPRPRTSCLVLVVINVLHHSWSQLSISQTQAFTAAMLTMRSAARMQQWSWTSAVSVKVGFRGLFVGVSAPSVTQVDKIPGRVVVKYLHSMQIRGTCDCKLLLSWLSNSPHLTKCYLQTSTLLFFRSGIHYHVGKSWSSPGRY